MEERGQREGVGDTWPLKNPWRSVLGKREDALVPIVLDVEVEGQKLRDCFLYNLNESQMSVLTFARELVKEFQISGSFIPYITAAIERQLKHFHVFVPRGELNAGVPEDRHIIKLDLRVGNKLLKDQFEWDILDPRNRPEEFARTIVVDLNLEPEFEPLIVHSIREQVADFAKQNFEQFPQYSRLLEEEEEREVDGEVVKEDTDDSPFYPLWGRTPPAHWCKPLTKKTILREDEISWEPVVDELTDEEIAKIDCARERDARYRRRTKELSSATGATLPALSELTDPPESGEPPPLVSISLSSGLSNFPQRFDIRVPPRKNVLQPGAAAGQVRAPPYTQPAQVGSHCINCLAQADGPMRRGPDGEMSLCDSCGKAWAVTGRFPVVADNAS